MNSRITVGIILIAIGIVFLIGNFDIFDFENIWPVVMIIPGFVLLYLTFMKKEKGFAVLGTILTILGIYFLYESYNNWNTIDELWPIFIITPGLGFIVMHFVEKMKKD